MQICYLDESGELGSAQDDHFVLLGLSIPALSWRALDARTAQIQARYRVAAHAEIHTAWIAKRYREQEQIQGFEQLSDELRRTRVLAARQRAVQTAIGGQRRSRIADFRKSEPYIHLTLDERTGLLRALADEIGSWQDARIFADAQMKSASRPGDDILKWSFDQVVSRFHHFLRDINEDVGILVQDQNPSASRRLTEIMRKFHSDGTYYARIPRVVETPLFVDSQLTSMVQMADLCSYALRRFCDRGETDLFDRVYPRAHRVGSRVVGVRHYTGSNQCQCKICVDHGR